MRGFGDRKVWGSCVGLIRQDFGGEVLLVNQEVGGQNEIQGLKRLTVRGLRFRHWIERLTAEEIEAEKMAGNAQYGKDGEHVEHVEGVKDVAGRSQVIQ